MEGNECYKFSTIQNYIEKTHNKTIDTIVDVGVNVGDISVMMNAYFPNARIYGFEAVREYYDIARSRTSHISSIVLFNMAVSSQHLFADDLGDLPRERAVSLRILKGLPEAGPGWAGGSFVLPEDHTLITRNQAPRGYEPIAQEVAPITLSEIIELAGTEEIDLLKMDCEGCEHPVLGCAGRETLNRVRFITGEYHDIRRFYLTMQGKLFQTHKVNLVGTASLGCFFAERLDGLEDGILRFEKTGMLVPRPWLCDFPIDWHVFNDEFVLENDRYWHALT